MNQMTKVSNEQNAIAVAGLFRDINFGELNSVIEAIGNKSGELTADEKQSATAIIQSWNHNVVNRIQNVAREMDEMLRLFSTSVDNRSHENFLTQTVLNEQQLMQLIAVTGTEALFNAFKEADQAMVEYKELNEPDRPFVDRNMSELEIVQAESEYRLAFTKYEIEYVKLRRKTVMAYREFIRTICLTDQVKAMVAKARAFKKNVDNLYSECDAKANMAKLNIQISSIDIRTNLRELMDFASRI